MTTVTDFTDAGIKAALGEATKPGGDYVVDMPAGIYDIQSSIFMLSNVTLRGVGRKTVLKAPSNVHVLRVDGVNNFHLCDFTIEGDGSVGQPGAHGIRFGSCSDGVVERIKIFGMGGYGIGSQAGTMTDVAFRDIDIEQTGSDAIDFKNVDDMSQNVVFERVAVRKFGQDNTSGKAGFDLRGSGFRLTDCTAEQITHGMTGFRCRQGEKESVNGLGAIYTQFDNCRAVSDGASPDAGANGWVINMRLVQLSNCQTLNCNIGFRLLQNYISASNCVAIDSYRRGWDIDGSVNSLNGCHSIHDVGNEDIDFHYLVNGDDNMMTGCRIYGSGTNTGIKLVGDGNTYQGAIDNVAVATNDQGTDNTVTTV